jgi:hypothetical protein
MIALKIFVCILSLFYNNNQSFLSVWDIPTYFRQRVEYATAVGNSLHCDCNALWLRNWLKRTGRSAVTCQSPETLKGVPLITVNDSDTVCGKNVVNLFPLFLFHLSIPPFAILLFYMVS